MENEKDQVQEDNTEEKNYSFNAYVRFLVYMYIIFGIFGFGIHFTVNRSLKKIK